MFHTGASAFALVFGARLVAVLAFGLAAGFLAVVTFLALVAAALGFAAAFVLVALGLASLVSSFLGAFSFYGTISDHSG